MIKHLKTEHEYLTKIMQDIKAFTEDIIVTTDECLFKISNEGANKVLIDKIEGNLFYLDSIKLSLKDIIEELELIDFNIPSKEEIKLAEILPFRKKYLNNVILFEPPEKDMWVEEGTDISYIFEKKDE